VLNYISMTVDNSTTPYWRLE